MLTQEDITLLRHIIREEVSIVVEDIVERKLAPIKKDIISMKEDIAVMKGDISSLTTRVDSLELQIKKMDTKFTRQLRKVRKDINITIRFFDNDIGNLHKRVERIDDHLHLPRLRLYASAS